MELFQRKFFGPGEKNGVKPNPPGVRNSYCPWTRKEERYLSENWSRMSVRDLEVALHRAEASLTQKAHQMGLLKEEVADQTERYYAILPFNESGTDHLGRKLLPNSFSAEYTLEQMGLPEDYMGLVPAQQKKLRTEVLTAWFDLQQPNVLCTSVDRYLTAHRLFVEFYMKRAKCNRALYYRPDPRHKYEMLRDAMSPSLLPSKPARALIMAARKSAKTVTLILEAFSLIGLFRPDSELLLSEIDKARTSEEMNRIRNQIMLNDVIQDEFGGGEKVLWASGKGARGKKWSEKQLDFLHNGSTIKGFSCNVSQRGRHPIYWVIDDPESDAKAEGPNWRKKFFEWLFGTGLGMMDRGGKVTWVYSGGKENTCAAYAMRGYVHPDSPQDVDKDLIVEEPDPRFKSWRRSNFQLIKHNEDGTVESIWPEYIDTDEWNETVEAQGDAAAQSEYQGVQVEDGDTVFSRNAVRHGYMHAVDMSDGHEYMLDFHTGDNKRWRDWLARLEKVLACDLGDGTLASNDPGAIVVAGVDENGIVYILDAMQDKRIAFYWIDDIVSLSRLWQVQNIIIEKLAFVSAITTPVRTQLQQLRRAGEEVPPIHPYKFTSLDPDSGKRTKQKKEKRIINTLGPLFRNDRIRMLRLYDHEDSDGHTHRCFANLRRRDLATLAHQIDRYTQNGCLGPDDLIDACAMACDFAASSRGTVEPPKLDPVDEALVKLEKVGIQRDRLSLPQETWGEKEWKTHFNEMFDERDDCEPTFDSDLCDMDATLYA